jgi:DNA-binding CsgD family transcriptional regulator
VIRAGARGYVTKSISPPELAGRDPPRARGRRGVLAEAGGLRPRRRSPPDGAGHRSELDQLTPREKEVLRFIAAGMRTRRSAAELHISVKTVESHVGGVLRSSSSPTVRAQPLGERTQARLEDRLRAWIRRAARWMRPAIHRCPSDERLRRRSDAGPSSPLVRPSGSRVAFALHATVADVGSHPSSDLYLVGEIRRAGPDHERSVERPEPGVVVGWISRSRSFPTDHPGHHLPTRWSSASNRSSQPSARSQRRRSRGPARATPARARGRSRLLRPGLERASGAGRRTTPSTPRDSAGRGAPAAVRDRPRIRRRHRGRAAGHERVGVRRGTDDVVVALVSEDPSTAGGIARSSPGSTSPNAPRRRLYRPTWSLEGLALSPDGRRAAVVEGYSSDPGC